MRSDMQKVIIERPRRDSRAPNRKFGARLRYIDGHDYEEELKHVPVSFSFRDYGCDRKRSTDVLGPLEHFLRTSLGKSWNDVYSEICAELDRRKVIGMHVFQHLWQLVERNCWIGQDGKPYVWGYRGAYPVYHFYVHPWTGLLCEAAPGPGARERRKAKLLAEEVTLVPLGNNRGYQKHEGIWYRVKLKYVFVEWYQRLKPPKVWDIFLKKEVALGYGGYWIAEEKQQASRDDLVIIRGKLAEREHKIRKM